jgi:ABC-2 type transport system ATP-binding protein
MADVEALCRRVIVIHHGRLLYDGDLSGLVNRFSPHKLVSIEIGDEPIDLEPYGEVVARVDGRVTLRVPKAVTASVTARMLTELAVTDLTVTDPPIEEVIEQVFAQGQAAVAS